MPDFIIDGQPYEPPESAAAEGYAQTPPPFGQAFGAMVRSGSPIAALTGAAERGQASDASLFDQALYDTLTNPASQGQFSTPGTPIPDRAPEPQLPPDEINRQFAPPGESITNKPMTATLGRIIGRQKAAEMQRDSVLSRSAAVNSWPVNFGAGMAAFMIDPLNAATSFIPGVGEEATMTALGRVGVEGLIARTAARGVAGGTAMAAQQVPLSLLQYGLGTEEASDFGMSDVLKQVFYGAALGAAFHAGFGTARELGILRPDAIMGEPVGAPRKAPPAPTPGSAETRAAVPPTAFSEDREAALTRAFEGEESTGQPVDLAAVGFRPEEVTALQRDGLAAPDGTMTADQWEAWKDEREIRTPAASGIAENVARVFDSEAEAHNVIKAAEIRNVRVESNPDGGYWIVNDDGTPYITSRTTTTYGKPESEAHTEKGVRTADELPQSPAAHADAMRAAMSEVLDGRPVDVQSVVENAKAAEPARIRTLEQIQTEDGVSAKKAAQIQQEEILARGRPISMDELAARKAGITMSPADVVAKQRDLVRDGYATGVPDTELRAASETLYAPKPAEEAPKAELAAKAPEEPKAEEKKPKTAPQPKAPPAPTPYAPEPGEPERLTQFIHRLGGVKDEGGDVRHLLGGAKYRPGLVNGNGLPLDEMALRAWENGYFPELAGTRPSINDLLEALEDDLKGEPRYSRQDEAAVEIYREAKGRNAEIDRLAHETGIDPEGKTREQFYDAVAEQMSLEQLAQEIASQAEAHEALYDEAERQAQEWVAYHGTPHEFDQFDTAHIGTGEGVQAYGRGLYFAESKDVAEGYQRTLSADFVTPEMRELAARLQRLGIDENDAMTIAGAPFPHETAAHLVVYLDNEGNTERARAITANLDEIPGELPDPEHVGNLYTVRIKAKPEEMLDWDASLKEQPKHVREALKSLGIGKSIEGKWEEDRPGVWTFRDSDGKGLARVRKSQSGAYWASGVKKETSFYNLDEAKEAALALSREELEHQKQTGAEIYHHLVEQHGYDQKAASEALKRAGVKGVHYLDARSRPAGEGTRNIVVFDHHDVEITHRNGEPVRPHAMTEDEAAEMRELGEPPAGRWNPEEFYGASQDRTLEDLENEYRQEEAATAARERTGGGEQPGTAAEHPGPVPEVGEPRGRGAGATGRGGEESAEAGVERAGEPTGTIGEPVAAAGESEPAPAATEPAGVAEERPKDANGNPIFKKGERAIVADGALKGRHGQVIEATGMRWHSAFGGKTTGSSYHYTVRTDSGTEAHVSKLEPETGEAPKVVLDPVYDGRPTDPGSLRRSIEYDRQAEQKAIGAESRARTPTSKRAQRDAATAARRTADAKQAVLDAWRQAHPDEAERVLPEPEESPQRAPERQGGMALVETTHTKGGYPLFVVSMGERVSPERFNEMRAAAKEGGGWWSSFRGHGAVTGWQFKTRGAAETFMRRWGGEEAPSLTPAEVTEQAAGNVSPALPGAPPAETPTERTITDALAPAQGKGPLPVTSAPTDLLGRPIAPKPPDRPPEPTIRNDERQTAIPGTEASAVQAQAARDQTGRGALLSTTEQKPADEGLFARPETAQPELPTTSPAVGANNKVFTSDAFEKARARMRERMGRLNAGFDPEMMLDGLMMAGFYVEGGARSFADYSRAMLTELGENVRPFLKHFYNSVRDYPGFDNAGMSTAAEVDAELERMGRAPEATEPLAPEDADRLVDAHQGEPSLDKVAQDLADGRTPEQISEEPGVPFSAAEITGIADALERRGEIPAPTEAKPEEEAENGVQGAVPVRDEGTGAEDVHGTKAVGEVGTAPSREVGGGAPAAGGAAGEQAEEQPRGAEPGGRAAGGGNRPGATDRVPGAGEGSESRATGRFATRPDAHVEGVNFSIEPGDLAEGRGPKAKARDNLAAIELAKRLIAEDRPATKAEQAILVKYVGWGGLKGAFEGSDGKFGKGFEDIGARLKTALTDEEYKTAAKSTQYAHYTAEHVIRSIWDAVRRMGFEGGSVFEPGMGIGHFLGLMPGDLAEKSRYQGIEMDGLTAAIAKLLYPESGIRQADFTRMALPEKAFDLVIGNPPFSDVVIHSDQKYAARNFMLHDYFFAKSLDAVRPGGLLGFVTSAGTMNKLDSAAREYLAERAEFVGGIRLPSSAFAKNAGTEVTTDILFFKRRLERRVELPEGEKPEWTQTVVRSLPNAAGEILEGNVSRYFSEHPENVLGTEGYFDKLYKDRYAVHQTPGTDLAIDLRSAIERLPENVMEPEPTPEQRAALDFESGQKKDGSFYLGKDGALMQYRDGAGRPVQQRGKAGGGFTAAETDRIQHLIPMRDALRDVFSADLALDDEAGAAARARLNEHYDRFVEKFGPINKAEFQYRRPTLIQQETARLEAREEARFVGERFDDGDFDPGPMLAAKAKISEIAKAREAARDAAKAAGRPFNEGTFDPSEMPDVVFERRPNIKPFMSDPESYRLRSIEHYDDATGAARKRAIFYENILKHEEEPEIRSANDGVLWSMNKLGRFDVDKIAEKMGRDRTDVIAELGDAVYKVPGTRDTYQTRDEYLSGDIVSNLETARAAAEHDPDVRRNIPALEAAVPPPLPPSEISMVLGMPWIPAETVQQFVGEHLDIGRPRIVHSATTGTWTITGNDEGYGGFPKWSIPERTAYELLSDAMNRTPPRIYSRERGPDGKTVSVFDPVATQAAQDKVDQIKQAFADWVHTDTGRSDGLAQLYNDKLNRSVLRQYDGSYLTTPGVSADWQWRPHQQRVVSRIVQDGNTYMAHAVGAGKTSAMIGAGMEMRRLGLVRKPLYVVPNHMLGQFTKEFYEQYPTARIAVADEERFHTDRRRQFMANVAQDDLDAVIMTHSSFGKIPISEDFQAHLIQEQIDMLQQAMDELDPQADRIARGRIENQKEKLEQRLSKRGAANQDQVLNFEEMGTDFLFVDEAHEFRKLSFGTKQAAMKGISPEGSNKAWDLYTKVRYLDSQRPGRSAVFASGTPVTNTMGELYTLSRFMQPEALKERGLAHFDSWAQTFGDTKTGLEETAAGTYQPVTRFGQFVNLPELYKMVGEVMDIVTPQQLEQYVTRPKLKGGAREFHLAPRTDILDAYQRELAGRMEAIKRRKGPPQKGDDILLSVINDGRHAAIDPRFVENTQNDPRSKLNIMVKNVARIWRETADTQFYDPRDGYQTPTERGAAAQMIFANLGVNPRGPMGFSSYQWIKEALRREGVPPDQIAFIGDYNGTIARQALFNDVNEGKVRVLVGSTQKMGTGVNAQRRLYALHNLDPLWYPADDEQRVGRILRQGNLNPQIEVHDYSTKGTYDSAMWKMMGNKARFIEQFFRGDPELRNMEDIGEASMYEQASAMATTDERIITLTQLKQDLDKAKRQESAHDRDQYSLRQQLKLKQWQAEASATTIKNLQEDVSRREETRGDKFSMMVDGKKIDKRADAAEALEATIREKGGGLGKGADVAIGRIGGFPLIMARGPSDDLRFALRMSGGHAVSLFADTGRGVIASAEHRLRGLEDDVTYAERERAKALQEAQAIKPLIGQEFQGRREILRLAQAVRDLEAQLRSEAEAKENPPKPTEDAEAMASQGPAARAGQEPAAPDPEMAEAEQRLAQVGAALSPEDRAEIAHATAATQEAEQQAAAFSQAADCLKGGM